MGHNAFGESHRNGTRSANPLHMFRDDIAARKNIEETVGPDGWRRPHCGTESGMPTGARP